MEQFDSYKLFSNNMKQKFYEEVGFLRTLFPSLDKIEGIIMKLDTHKGFDNYQKEIGDPMKEDTLIIGDPQNNVLLFFKCSNDRKHKTEIFEGITILDIYCYNKESTIYKKGNPINVPSHLERYVFDFASEDLSLYNSFSGLKIRELGNPFVENNYRKGGMMPLKKMKSHPEWKELYRADVEIKKVQVCKSCGKKSAKGCCLEYSTKNRSVLTMVIGWSDR